MKMKKRGRRKEKMAEAKGEEKVVWKLRGI